VSEGNRETSVLRGPWPTRGVQAAAKVIILIVTKSFWFFKRFLDKFQDLEGILTDQSPILFLPAVNI
jgi:hypothetical protein